MVEPSVVQITEVSEVMSAEPEAPLSFLLTEMVRSSSAGVLYWSPSAPQPFSVAFLEDPGALNAAGLLVARGAQSEQP